MGLSDFLQPSAEQTPGGQLEARDLADDMAGNAPVNHAADGTLNKRQLELVRLTRGHWAEGKVNRAEWSPLFAALLTGASSPAQVAHAADLADLAWLTMLGRQNGR